MDEKKEQEGDQFMTPEEDTPQEETLDMETLLAQEGLGLASIPQKGEIRKGEITAIMPHEILIDVQSKADGVITGYELDQIDEETLGSFQVGEEISVYVVEPEDPNGNVVLSYTRAKEEKDWKRVEEMLESGETLDTIVEGFNKGGLLVPVGELRGFVPGSLVSVFREQEGETPEERWEETVGETITLKVIEVDRSRQRLILSERDAIGETREAIKEQLIEDLEVGDRVTGYVSSLADFGAFVNIQGVDGLVHLSELSWEHVDHPRDVVKVGQEVKVEVISLDEEKRRIGLSLRRLEDDPWKEKIQDLEKGQLVRGTVTNLTDFGAFARINDSELEGLIHISELSIQRVGHPSEVVSVGDELTLRVINLDEERRRIGLSLEKVDSDEYASYDYEKIQEEFGEEIGLEEDEISEAEEPAEDEVAEEDEPSGEAEAVAEEAPEEEDEEEGEEVPEGEEPAEDEVAEEDEPSGEAEAVAEEAPEEEDEEEGEEPAEDEVAEEDEPSGEAEAVAEEASEVEEEEGEELPDEEEPEEEEAPPEEEE
jgi:small subunit ribosomal protein S1